MDRKKQIRLELQQTAVGNNCAIGSNTLKFFFSYYYVDISGKIVYKDNLKVEILKLLLKKREEV